MVDMVEFLEEKIDKKSSLEEILDAFEEVCEYPVDSQDELKFWETGEFPDYAERSKSALDEDFSLEDILGNKKYFFDLVRQYDGEEDEDEYTQLHVTAVYLPEDVEDPAEELVFEDTLDEDFFDYIRKSDIYKQLKEVPIYRLDIYKEET